MPQLLAFLKKFFVFLKGGAKFVVTTHLMLNRSIHNIITNLTAIIIVVVIIIPAITGGESCM